jgi:hypothetical protein
MPEDLLFFCTNVVEKLQKMQISHEEQSAAQ